MNYRPEIDGLRALAVVPVIFFHAGFKVFSGGFIGVDVFFVISGYLITSQVIKDIDSGNFSLNTFYERRARRILPALFFVMFACIPFAWLWLLPRDMEAFSQSLIAVTTFISNVLYWKTSGYFDITSELKPLLHTWSLAVEEQYYLFFPILLLWIPKGKKHIRALTIITLLLLSLTLAQWGAKERPEAAYYLLLTRGWEILLGAILSLHTKNKLKLESSRVAMEIGGSIGFALILFSIFTYTKYTPFPGAYALIPTLGACLIINFASPATAIGKLLASSIAIKLGLISYSAYLWHQPLLAFARHRFFEGLTTNQLIAIVASTFFLAHLTWRFVETPFRNKNKFPRDKLYKYSLTVAILFILIGMAGISTSGFMTRFSQESAHDGDIGQTDFYKLIDKNNSLCHIESLASDPKNKVTFRCLQTMGSSDPSIALIGDSHAEHLFPGLAEINPETNILIFARGSYPTISNKDFKKTFHYIASTKSIHSVIITAYWVNRIEMLSNHDDLEDQLSETIDFLQRNGKIVYLFGDVPQFPFAPERCKFLAANMGDEICTVSSAYVNEYEHSYAEKLAELSNKIPGLKYFNLKDIFCTAEACSMLIADKLMYRDSHHLNLLGSRFAASKIMNKFPEISINTKNIKEN